MTPATTRRRRDWTEHDASVPFRCPVLFRLNGTNRVGRRPHSSVEPQRLQAANDNRNAAPAIAREPIPNH